MLLLPFFVVRDRDRLADSDFGAQRVHNSVRDSDVRAWADIQGQVISLALLLRR